MGDDGCDGLGVDFLPVLFKFFVDVVGHGAGGSISVEIVIPGIVDLYHHFTGIKIKKQTIRVASSLNF